MSKQISDLDKPNTLPLNVILAGTLVLAVPSAPATLLLIAEISNHGQTMKSSTAVGLFVASLLGFALLFGYIWMARTHRHNSIFWICSTIFNLYLSYDYCFTAVNNLTIMDKIPIKGEHSIIPVVLLIWTLVAGGCSAYYVVHAWQLKQLKRAL